MLRSTRELSDLIAAVYAAGLDTRGLGWTQVCERLSHLVAAGGSVAIGLQRGRLAYAASHAVGLDAESLVRYQMHYRCIDPVFEPRLPSAPPGAMLISDALMSPGELRRTEFDSDWLRPHGFGVGMAAVLVRHRSAESAIYLARPRQQGSFTRKEIEIFGLLLPHLSGAVRTSLRLVELDAVASALGRALDHWAQAVVLVDSSGRVCATNRAAEVMLGDADGLFVERSRDFRRGPLTASTPAATKALRRLIEDAARIGTLHPPDSDALALRQRMTLRLDRPSGRPALAALISPLAWLEPPVDKLGELHSAGSQATVAIFIFDPGGGDAASTADAAKALLCEAYGLTSAESEVACALAVGDGLAAVAESRGVTLATVRTQALHIYRKTGVRGQAALARLVDRLAQVR